MMTAAFILFLALIWVFFEFIRKESLSFDDEDILRLKTSFEQNRDVERQLLDALDAVNEEVDKQYMIYELTTEISQSSNRDDAFQIFKTYLKQHAAFQSCELISAQGSQIEVTPRDAQTQIFYIRSEEDVTNFLIVEGINPDDAEKVSVLGHQFALVYRRLELYSQLEKTAVTDDLTGLFTRRHIMESLGSELHMAQMHHGVLSFVMIDVDHFKRYNDQHGHLVGDQILRQVSATVRGSIREVDMAGRFGGEEFCLILPNTGLEGARLTAERIRKALQDASMEAFKSHYQVTASFGIAVFPDHALTSDRLVEAADQALYKAKAEGRNRVCVSDSAGRNPA